MPVLDVSLSDPTWAARQLQVFRRRASNQCSEVVKHEADTVSCPLTGADGLNPFRVSIRVEDPTGYLASYRHTHRAITHATCFTTPMTKRLSLTSDLVFKLLFGDPAYSNVLIAVRRQDRHSPR